MFPTPSLAHFKYEEYNDFYEPAEDTFLFLDALELELPLIDPKPKVCVEVGSGSGTVITFAAKLLGKDVAYFATDINPKAVAATQRTAVENHVQVTCVESYFTSALPAVEGLIDVLLFNPPYVPTPEEEMGRKDITAAWAGGLHGRQVVDAFMATVPQLLAKHGKLYIVALEANLLPHHPDNMLTAWPKLDMRVVMSRRAGIEMLHILCGTLRC